MGFGTVVEADGKITIGGKKTQDATSKGLDRKLSNGRPDTSFEPTSSIIYGGYVLPGLVKLTNQKYVLWTTNSGLTNLLDKFSSSGVYESSTSTDQINGNCPMIIAGQSDGKLIESVFGQNAAIQQRTRMGFCRDHWLHEPFRLYRSNGDPSVRRQDGERWRVQQLFNACTHIAIVGNCSSNGHLF